MTYLEATILYLERPTDAYSSLSVNDKLLCGGGITLKSNTFTYISGCGYVQNMLYFVCSYRPTEEIAFG